MDEGRMKRFIPGRWKGEGGGVDRKRLLGHANALWTARWRRKQQTLFVAALEERARIQFQEGGAGRTGSDAIPERRCWKNGLGCNSRKVENAWKDFDKFADSCGSWAVVGARDS